MIQNERLCEIVELVNEIGYEKASDKLGLAKSTIERYIREYNKRVAMSEIVEGDKPKVISEVRRKDEIDSTVVTSSRFTTVEQLAEYCNINLDIWEAFEITSGEYGVATNPAWQFKVRWKRIKGLTPEMVLDTFSDKLHTLPSPKLKNYTHKLGEVALEANIPDLHLGRLAWAKETGKPYDVNIAVDEWMKAHYYFYDMTKHLDIDTVIIPVGNDFFNVDNNINSTNHGTQQIEDGRWQRSFSKGCDAVINAVEFWRTKQYRVIIKIIPGNHDTQRAFYLGAFLEAWYREIDTVEIDNRPTLRKYYVYGRNLIGWSHGQSDYKRLKTVYQSEMREYLSQCDCIEIHTGHIHQEKVVEDYGSVILRTVPSLAQNSNWEYEMGYTGNRRAQAFVWHKAKGLMNIVYYTPDFLDK